MLAKYGLWDEAAETIRWAKDDPRLGACDLNLLKIIESLLYYQQNHYFLAFNKFRSNFRTLESVRLPNFLSGIFFPRQYEDLIAAYSREQEVDPALVLALIREESFFRPDVALAGQRLRPDAAAARHGAPDGRRQRPQGQGQGPVRPGDQHPPGAAIPENPAGPL